MTIAQSTGQQFELEPSVPNATVLRSFDNVIIDKRAMSIHCKQISTLEDHLHERVKAIVGDNNAIREVRSSIMDYEFSAKVGAEIWPRFTDKPTKTELATLQLTMLDKIVDQNTPDTTEPVRRVVSALLGVMLQHQGIMSIEMPTLYVTIPESVFPLYETIKKDAMLDGTYASLTAIPIDEAFYKNAVGNLALKSFAEVFARYGRIFNEIVQLSDSVDTFAAGVILSIHDKDSILGTHKGYLDHPSIEAAKRNYTFVRAIHDYFFDRKGYPNIDSLVSVFSQVGVGILADKLQNAWQLINQIEHFEFSQLSTLKNRVNIYRFINNVAAPIGVVCQPLFKGEREGFNISFFDDKASKIINLEQDKLSESYFEPLTVAVHDNVRNAINSVAPLLSTVIMNEQGLMNFGDDVINASSLNNVYAPFGMYIGLDDVAINHLAMSFAEQMSFGDPADTSQCRYAYFFTRRQRDPEYYLRMVSTDLAYSEAPNDVILFAGYEGTSAATTAWNVGPQTLPDVARPSKYLPKTGFENDLLPESALLLDKEQRLTREIKFNIEVPDGKGDVTKHATTVSLYELYAGSESSKWRKDLCYPIAHVSPLLSKQTTDLAELFLYVAKQPTISGMVHAPAERVRVQFANLMAPMVKSATFKRLLVALRARILAGAVTNTMEQRVALRYHLKTKDIDLKLSASLVRYLLVRLGLLDWDTAAEVYENLLNTDTFYTTILPLLVDE